MTNRVFKEEWLRDIHRESASPIVEIFTGDDKPWTESTMTIARHADGTFTILDVNIVRKSRGC